MVTTNIYSSMIGRHYAKREVKELCALIDQRIEYKLPSFALRTRLLELINDSFMKGVALKKDLEKKVMRDLDAYPANLESSYMIRVTLLSGEQCCMNINCDSLQWTDTENDGTSITAPIDYGISWAGNIPERTFSATYEGEHGVILSPVISRESVIKTDNFGVLMLMFQIPSGQPKLILEKSCPDCKFGPVSPVGGLGIYESSKFLEYICGNCQSEFYVKGGL